jgi:murein L,D-transpeptidase YafK
LKKKTKTRKTTRRSKKRSVFDRLKDIDTEDRMTMNEKCVPKFEASNVVNLTVSTNNEVPVFVEKSDRRYVICECNPKYLNKPSGMS